MESEAQRKQSAGSVINYYIAGDVNTGSGDFIGRDKAIRASQGGVAVGGDVNDDTI